MHSDLLFSLVTCGKRTKVHKFTMAFKTPTVLVCSVGCWLRRAIMKRKLTGAAGLAGAFIAGMLVATALGGGMTAAGAKAPAAPAQGQQVTVQRVFSPTVTDEDIALLRRDV